MFVERQQDLLTKIPENSDILMLLHYDSSNVRLCFRSFLKGHYQYHTFYMWLSGVIASPHPRGARRRVELAVEERKYGCKHDSPISA
jgi:hypothetical protein